MLEASTKDGLASRVVFLEGLGGPDTELRAALGIYAVADRYDGVKIVVLHRTANRAGAFPLNCCIFCNSSFSRKFLRIVNILQVPGNNRFIAVKEIRHLVQG